MREDVLSQVSKLMQKHTERRDAAVRDTVQSISSGLVEGQQEMDKFKTAHGSNVNSILAHDKELLGRMEKRSNDTRKFREETNRAFKELTGSVEAGVGQSQDLIHDATAEQIKVIEQSTLTLETASSGAFERLEKGRRARVDEITEMRDDSEQTREYMETSLAVSAQAVNDVVEHVVSTVRGYSSTFFPLRFASVLTRIFKFLGIRGDSITSNLPTRRFLSALRSSTNRPITWYQCRSRGHADWKDS